MMASRFVFVLNFSRSSHCEPSADNLITDYLAFLLADKHTALTI